MISYLCGGVLIGIGVIVVGFLQAHRVRRRSGVVLPGFPSHRRRAVRVVLNLPENEQAKGTEPPVRRRRVHRRCDFDRFYRDMLRDL